MITLTIDHYGLEDAERTYLSSPIVKETTSIPVKNNRGFAADDYFIIGDPGNEKTEQLKVSSTTSTTTLISSASSVRSHSADDPVVRVKYNQIQIYLATSSTGSYSLLTTVDIEWDQTFTSYIHTAGASPYYYKWKFYNDVSGLATDYSHAIPGSGFGRKSVKTMTDNVLKEGGDENKEISDREEILGWLNHAQDDIQSRLSERFGYSFLKVDTNLVTTADTEYISCPSDYDKLDYIQYAYSDGETTYKLRYVSPAEFDYLTEDDNAEASDALQKYTIDEEDQRILFYPRPETASLTVGFHYFKDMPELDDDGDETVVPVPRVLEVYAIEKLLRKRGTEFDRRADRYKADYENGVTNLLQKYKRRAGPKSLYLMKYVPDRERRYYLY